jgi:hypothetical protein
MNVVKQNKLAIYYLLCSRDVIRGWVGRINPPLKKFLATCLLYRVGKNIFQGEFTVLFQIGDMISYCDKSLMYNKTISNDKMAFI